MRRLILPAFCLAFSWHMAAADDFPFGAARYPALPQLTVDAEPAVCAPFLAALTAAFKGPDFDIDLVDKAFPGADARWIFPVPEDGRPGIERYDFPVAAEDAQPADRETAAWIWALPADTDRDGKPEVLAAISWEFNWQGDRHALVLYPSREGFEHALQDSKTREQLLGAGFDVSPEAGDYPIPRAPSTTWAVRRVVAINGATYALDEGEVYNDNTRYALWRIDGLAAPRKACEALAQPDARGYSLGPLKGTAVAEFDALLGRISGGETGMGTAHFQANVLGEAGRVRSRLALRPWVLGQASLYNGLGVVETSLAVYAEASLYNNRLVRAMPAAKAKAVVALAQYYANSFGLPAEAAQDAAAAAIDLLERSYFVFTSGGLERMPDTAYRRLTRALLRGAPRGEIASLFDSGAKIRDTFTSGMDDDPDEAKWAWYPEEPTLFYALEHSAAVLELLARGADPNVTGNFGKTALMYAAQFDLHDAAKILLIYGADPNAGTTDEGEEAVLQESGRTALMYAAENASAKLIRLLLKYHADGRTVLDYLARNTKLTDTERAALAAEIKVP